jgi:hypothetical protein
MELMIHLQRKFELLEWKNFMKLLY